MLFYVSGDSEDAPEGSRDAAVSSVLLQHGLHPHQAGPKDPQVSSHPQRAHQGMMK